MTGKTQMHLGVFGVGTGNHVAGWRHPGAVTSSEDFPALVNIARIAEASKFDFIFFADNPACIPDDHPGFMLRLEPTTLLAGLATHTTHLGLVATSSTSYNEPYNLARQFASVDKISGGRAAWNVVTSPSPAAAFNFGRESVTEHGKRYEIATEFVETVQGLWDSWEENPLVLNRETGQYYDPGKVHVLDHKGPYYKVRGPLNLSRSPQGQPVIVQAGSSDTGQAFAARFAEVILTVQHDIDESRKFCANVKEMAKNYGRQPGHIKVMPGFFPIVGDTDEDARRKLNDLMKYVDSTSALRTMSERYGHDMSQYPLDGPVPDLPLSQHSQGYTRVLLTKAKRDNYTLRDLYNNMAVARGYIVACGSVKTVADMMEEWFTSRACDGFIITPAYFPDALIEFNQTVVPELQRRGLFRTEYRGKTLRDNLGLPIPENRYARARNMSAAE